MADLALLIPITGFVAVAAIIIAVAHFRTEQAKAELTGGGDYRRLAEEATNGQQAVLDEVRRMNATLKEIERLLREV